jgi:hypothetical protein
VFLDDDMVYDSGLKHGNDARVNVAIDVKGSRQLRLVVTDGGDGSTDDNADWGAARVMGCDFSETMSGTPASKAENEDTAKAKPAADSSKAMPSSSESRANEKKNDKKADAGVVADKSTRTSSSRSASTASAEMTDAGAQPVSTHKSGCSVAQVSPTRVPFTWLVLLSLGFARWRRSVARRRL